MEKTDEGLGGMDCMRDVVFHKLFAPIFELIHENISCEQKRSPSGFFFLFFSGVSGILWVERFGLFCG